jgi:hypothetical protein
MNRTARTIRFAAASTLALTAAGLTLGSVSAQAIPLPTIPTPTIVLPTVPLPPVTLGPIITIDPSIWSSTVALNAPAGPVDRGANYAYSMTVSLGSGLTGPVNLLHSIPATVNGAVWSCSTTGGATCGGSATGSGNISRALTMPGGSSVTFLVNGTITADAVNFALSMSAVRAGSPIDRSVAVAVNVPAAPTTTPPTPAVTTTIPTVPPTAPPTVPPAPTTVPAPITTPTTAPAPTQPIVVVIQTPASNLTVKGLKKAKKKAKLTVRRTNRRIVAKSAR